MSRNLSNFSAYILPGHVADARAGLEQARVGEALGLGAVFLSERWDSKELGTVMGALSQATERIRLVAGLTHFGTRHPLVTAGMSATLQTLSGGRFELGFGRSVPSLLRQLGIKTFSNVAMADFAMILRQLWRGETVSYQGPAGDFPNMQLARPCASPPPLLLGAVGPNTLKLGGTHFDAVVLHPFLSAEGVQRSVALVHNAARAAGRDPAAVKIYATVVTVPDTLPADSRHDLLEARAVSYFMHRDIGLLLAEFNGWDSAPVEQVVQRGLDRLEFGASDIATARRQLAETAALLPSHWFSEGAAIGSLEQCVRRMDDYFAAGADDIVLHGPSCQQQQPLIERLAAAVAK